MEKTVRMLDALSDAARMRAFLLVSREELCVCELVRILKMKQSRISHIMKKLSEAGLVKRRREGKWMLYSIDPAARGSSAVKGILKELSISTADRKEFTRCKRNGVRENCDI